MRTTTGAPMFARQIRFTLLIALLCATTRTVPAQTIVTGVVRADSGAPIVGAAIRAAGTHSGAAMTDTAGRYRFVVPKDGADKTDSVTVIARAIGFAPASRRIAARTGSVTVNFALKPTVVHLDEVVATSGGIATDAGAPAVAKERAKDMIARRELAASSEVRDARVASAPAPAAPTLKKARADGSRVAPGRGIVSQEPSPGVLTAAVWDDSQHWSQYERFLGRASENSWNPWGLDVGQRGVRPVRRDVRPRSARRALDLGFLVDATGSMGDEMTFLQSELKDIVRRVRAVEPDLDIRLSVVFYRDRGDAFLTKSLPFTRSADDAVSFISGTTADGGG